MALEQLMETATEIWNNPDARWYLTMVAGGYIGKLAVELSGYWNRRVSELNEMCGDETAKKYRSRINKINALPFPLDFAYSISMLFD
jgi:hypothetical protein